MPDGPAPGWVQVWVYLLALGAATATLAWLMALAFVLILS